MHVFAKIRSTGNPNLSVAFLVLSPGGSRSIHNWGPAAQSQVISQITTCRMVSPAPLAHLGMDFFLSKMLPLFPFKFCLYLKVNVNIEVGGRGWGQLTYNLLIPNLGEILLLWPSSPQTKLVRLVSQSWTTLSCYRNHPCRWCSGSFRRAASRADGWVPIHKEILSTPAGQPDFSH